MSRADKRRRKGPKFMRIGKHEKPAEENIKTLLAPSVLNIMLCMVCLAGMTWAWFSADSTAAVSRIEAAEYDVEVTVMESALNGNADGDTDEAETAINADQNGADTLDATKAYFVTLKASGTATEGYCFMYLSTEQDGTIGKYYAYLKNEESISFTIYPSVTQKMSFNVSWNKAELNGLTNLSDVTQIGEEPIAEPAVNAEANGQEENSQQTEALLPSQNPTANIGANNSTADNEGQDVNGGQTGNDDDNAENNGDNKAGENTESSEHNGNDGQNDVLSGENKGSENSSADSENENPASGDSEAGVAAGGNDVPESGSAGDNPGTLEFN